MPNRDGTGPMGQGPFTGRRGNLIGRGQATVGKGLGGSKQCTCPKCGHTEIHTRGIPCSEKICPKCNVTMKGAYCL